jgi:class 3 adenylate cyclase
MQALKAVNEALPAAEELAVAIGIGYGPVLMIGEYDIYGDEMNLACKLGEDLAQRGEVLLTRQAHTALGETPWRFIQEEYSVSGIELEAFRLTWESV